MGCSVGSEETVMQWEKTEMEDISSSQEKIFVSVRLRPLNAREIGKNNNDGSDWECVSDNTIIFKNSIPERSMYPTAYTLVFCFTLSTVESSAHEFLGKDNSTTLSASVNFVDLAGSERASQALSAGTRLKEGCHINRSLLTLGTVIRKLSNGRNGHVPYRDSKLTRILQPSLGGNERTAIICTISPARNHLEQSKNTLLFASCAKEVSTKLGALTARR
ncbi:kinesin-like protein KIN-7E [Papaver somniferum]|uniref:kinesin-like protein KIN-7E n=1 Tax=Papaver somniferum TaxID=3469 RepID=UPI000E6F4A52|nr:kinesin-like protein KIN-7E [Papaver somniferum]